VPIVPNILGKWGEGWGGEGWGKGCSMFYDKME